MNRVNKTLGALLALQVVLVAATWSMCGTSAPEPSASPVFGFNKDNVVELEVSAQSSVPGQPGESVKLVKQKDKWVIASADQYPADDKKVGEVLEKLVGLRISSPIATSAVDHVSLGVSNVKFERKVTIKTASAAKTILLGKGTGSACNLRYDGKNEVYRAVGASVWSVPTLSRSYVDTAYLTVDVSKLTSAVVTNPKGRLTFGKAGESWALAELPSGDTLDTSKTDQFVGQIAKISLNEPIGKTVKPEYGLPGPTEVVLASTDGATGSLTTKRYTLGNNADKEGQYVYLKADDNDYVVTISKWEADQIRDKDVAALIKKKADPAAK
jgi:hypothetical protein